VIDGCDYCDRDGPATINVVIMAKLNPELDPEAGWETYVDAVNSSSKFSKKWPGLVYNPDSWLEDLSEHMLFRRVEKASGIEAGEREQARVSISKKRWPL
jgi:hypothetical protein